ncbi:hypothetical protein ACFL2J_06995 [Candidatus Omnitrophota bacterium]
MEITNTLYNCPKNLYFPLDKYGYFLEEPLNNSNRWNQKIVCSILDKDYSRYISTTLMVGLDYFKLIEIYKFMSCHNKITPRIIRMYPEHKTILCESIGEFLLVYLKRRSFETKEILAAVFDYFRELQFINQHYERFIVPLIIEISLQLDKKLMKDFEFLPRFQEVLPHLKEANVKFAYGYGIEDPHIWNFRVEKVQGRVKAFTTDFDYFSSAVNCDWELGYFYATFRWLRESDYFLANKAEGLLLSLIKGQDVRSQFMFWLGVLSSYCGYRDSLINQMKDGRFDELEKQRCIISELDKTLSSLACNLLENVKDDSENDVSHVGLKLKNRKSEK